MQSIEVLTAILELVQFLIEVIKLQDLAQDNIICNVCLSENGINL